MRKRNLVIGAGISGAVIANRIANLLNEDVLVIDRLNHLAGACYDYISDNGINIHKYGAHIFHTNNEDVYKLFAAYSEIKPYFHRVLANINGETIPLPVNFKSIEKIFPHRLANDIIEQLISNFGFGSRIPILKLKRSRNKKIKLLYDYIFNNIFKDYTAKQWGMDIDNIDESVISRVPLNCSYDSCYFSDKYQGIPEDGYTNFVKKLLDNPLITVELGRTFCDVDMIKYFDRVYYSGSVDELFNFKHGELPYRSLLFRNKTIPGNKFQEASVVNYPNNFDFTRIIEHKYFSDTPSSYTDITFEYPCNYCRGKNLPFYPINNQDAFRMYNMYKNESEKFRNLYFVGRLGLYKYINMDEAIALSLKTLENSLR